VIGDVLRGLKRALVFQIRRDAGGAEGMVADPGLDAGVESSAGVLLPHGVAREFAGLAGRRFVVLGQKCDQLLTAPHFKSVYSPSWFRWPVPPAVPWPP